ncbi:MAG: beta-N-acetylhexosaminidase [Elusimicrobiota bacterium]
MLLEELVGRTLIFGIPGTRVTPADVRLFKETRAGGIIFYRINFESPARLKGLIADMESALGRRLLVTTDHEGGRVVMFRDGVTIFPDGLTLGRTGKIAYARRQGETEGRELRRLGVDVNFAPVADVLTEEFSPNIGIRAYGRDPALVARLAAARIRAMQKAGVSACAKHFPGLGRATKDPHLDLPVIRSTWKDIRRNHLKPFLAAMEAGVDGVMSSHPLYPNLEPAPRTPATFSRRLIHGLLREELGYKGVIFSDDMEMGALKKLCPMDRAAVLAARAGHDMILSCHRADVQRQIHRGLLDAYKSGELSVAELEKSVERIDRLGAERIRRFGPGRARAERDGSALALRIAREGTRVRDPRGLLPLEGRRSVSVIFPRLSELSLRIMIERPLESERAFLKDNLPQEAAVHILSMEPRPAEIARAVRGAREAEATVLFCFDAHLSAGWRRALRDLQKSARRFVLVLLRDPYDEEYAAPSTAVVTAYGFRLCQIRACLEKIFP